MRGKRAKMLRRLAGYRPGTTTRYILGHERKDLRCAGARAYYKELKRVKE
jgi:hypothetical protein